MRCFTHQAKEAIGVCKACSKGICADCAADLGHSISCKSPSCEAKAHLMDSSIKRGEALFKQSSALLGGSTGLLKGSKRLINIFPILCTAMGLAFIYHGSQEYPGADPAVTSLLMSLGIGLLIVAGIYFVISRKWIQIPDSEK